LKANQKKILNQKIHSSELLSQKNRKKFLNQQQKKFNHRPQKKIMRRKFRQKEFKNNYLNFLSFMWKITIEIEYLEK